MERGNLLCSAPDKSATVLLLIDVINDLDFPEADSLLVYVVPMARRIASLNARAKQAGVYHRAWAEHLTEGCGDLALDRRVQRHRYLLV